MKQNIKIEVVIGANYGDEGKGLFTEYLCRNRPKSIVVLSNGGCQRGHTVNNVELDIRHIFSHFGSGTLLGIPSIFSKTFLLNPIRFVNEKLELKQLGIDVQSYRAPDCILQLPCDMYINQSLEAYRNDTKHGSCGWGIWETIVRNEKRPLLFNDFEKMSYSNKYEYYLNELNTGVNERLISKNISFNSSILDIIKSKPFIDHFIQDFEYMASECKCLESNDILENSYVKDFETIIVENAQGLLLDKYYAPTDGNFRTDIHSTPSDCGIIGAIKAVGNGIEKSNVTANYITRTYFTRHGRGPFPEESNGIFFNDRTNIHNQYQESLRFGPMNISAIDRMMSRINADTSRCSYINDSNIVVTHCNEKEPLDYLKARAKFLSYKDDSRYVMPKIV